MATGNGETSTGPKEEQAALSHGHNPATVSSLSSIDTAGYDYNDASLCNTNDPQNDNNDQQSANPRPLPPIPNSSNASAGDHLLSLPQSYFPSDTIQSMHQQPQSQASLPSHLTSSSVPLMGQTTMRLSPTTRVVVPSAPSLNTVPEFLCSLTKMLTDDNRDVIEWSNGRIEVHNPHKLETHVLNRYFRHSKFASFQRQLNYFGFSKRAGKGKMAPCSYVNDSTTNELGSLLLVKRKQGNEPKAKTGGKKRDRDSTGSAPYIPAASAASKPVAYAAGHVLPGANTLGTTGNSGISNMTVNQSQKALARVAVGKGVRHGFVPNRNSNAAAGIQNTHQTPCVVAPSPVQASLNALTNNYRNSLNELRNADQGELSGGTQSTVTTGNATGNAGDQSGASSFAYVPGSLRRDDSLVDLAMIPLADEGNESTTAAASTGFSFVDFPFDPDFLSNEDLNESAQE